MARLKFIDGMDSSLGAECATCGRAVWGRAKTCTQCQRKKALKGGITALICAEFALGAFFMVIQPMLKNAQVFQTVVAQAAPAPRAQAAPITGWLYYDTEDTAVGDVTHHARLISNNAANPSHDPRLAGITRGTLLLSASSRYGRAVTVSFGPVKTACAVKRGGKPCALRAIFDETQPIDFPYTDASSEEATVLMLSEYDRFTQRLAVAHDLTVVASLGTGHDQIMTFDVSGYRRMALNGTAEVIQLAAR